MNCSLNLVINFSSKCLCLAIQLKSLYVNPVKLKQKISDVLVNKLYIICLWEKLRLRIKCTVKTNYAKIH